MIQIAQHIGADIFVTVSSADKCDLMKECGIQEDHIFNSRDLSFTKGINRMTDGQGVDVIINTLTGEALRQTWSCISPFGRFVELGKQDVLANNGLEMKHFSANASFALVNVQVRSPECALYEVTNLCAGNLPYSSWQSCIPLEQGLQSLQLGCAEDRASCDRLRLLRHPDSFPHDAKRLSHGQDRIEGYRAISHTCFTP